MSRRMGRDKGLIPDGNDVRIKKIYDVLSRSFHDIYLSIRNDQKDLYQKFFSESIFIYDQKKFVGIKGPLLGLVSFSERFPGAYFFVSACDLPDITQDLTDCILNSFSHESGYDAYIFWNSEKREPLFGIYNAEAILRYVQGNSAAAQDCSLQSMLKTMKVLEISISANMRDLLKNYNFPDS